MNGESPMRNSAWRILPLGSAWRDSSVGAERALVELERRGAPSLTIRYGVAV